MGSALWMLQSCNSHVTNSYVPSVSSEKTPINNQWNIHKIMDEYEYEYWMSLALQQMDINCLNSRLLLLFLFSLSLQFAEVKWSASCLHRLSYIFRVKRKTRINMEWDKGKPVVIRLFCVFDRVPSYLLPLFKNLICISFNSFSFFL